MTTAAIDEVFASAVARAQVPGVVAIAVDRGGMIYEGAFGHARVAENVPMDIDSIFRIASMTKAITSVAALQLVERGVLSLDAPASEVLPELANLEVLLPGGGTRPAVRPVTLRHLLSHTSGFAYAFSSVVLSEYLAAQGDTRPGGGIGVTPLLFDPGEGWVYGTSTDWAGQVVEAATGMTLDAYMRANIFDPLGMDDTGFHVDVDRLVSQHARDETGAIIERPFAPPAPPSTFSGGGGLSSTARDYARFLRLILNGGELDGACLFGPGTMAELTTNQSGDFAAAQWISGAPGFSCDCQLSNGGTSRHSLGFVLSTQPSPSGRAAGSLSWGGIYNTYYWIDPARGLAGAVFCQYLPFADPVALGLLDTFEREVYAAFG